MQYSLSDDGNFSPLFACKVLPRINTFPIHTYTHGHLLVFDHRRSFSRSTTKQHKFSAVSASLTHHEDAFKRHNYIILSYTISNDALSQDKSNEAKKNIVFDVFVCNCEFLCIHGYYKIMLHLKEG